MYGLVILMAILFVGAPKAEADQGFKFGSWELSKEINRMSDEVECYAIQIIRTDGVEVGAQLASDGLYIGRIRGGIRLVTMRFDNGPENSRLDQGSERDANTVILKDNEFMQVLRAKRLRIQVMTYFNTLPFFDIDLDGIQEAHSWLKECEEEHAVPKQRTAEQRQQEEAQRIEEQPPGFRVEEISLAPEGFAVQLGSFSSEENAAALRDRLRGKGYSAFLDRAAVDGRTVFRVLVGPDARREHSERLRDRLAGEMDLRGVVVAYEYHDARQEQSEVDRREQSEVDRYVEVVRQQIERN